MGRRPTRGSPSTRATAAVSGPSSLGPRGVAEQLGIGPDVELTLVMDNWGVHGTKDVQDEAKKVNMKLVDGYPPRSPQFNPPENLFSRAQALTDEWFVSRGRPDGVDDAIARFKEAVKVATDEGTIANTVASLPGRVKACIEAGGGPFEEHRRGT